jgi:HPt (histidine-containing phosphotransfer) domain-containing protein
MKEMFLEKGFSDYISKPIEIARLDEIMFRWIPAGKRIKDGTGIKRETFSGKTGIAIPGVNTQKGITMTGGTEAGYRKVLAQFRKDAVIRLPAFAAPPAEMTSGDNREDSVRNLSGFVIQAHALKSAAGTIGATELSAEAAALEAAGKAGDTQKIREALPLFREHLTQLIEAIEKNLEKKSGELGVGGEENEAPLTSHFAPHPSLSFHPFLQTLKGALEAKSMKDIDRIFEEIEQLPLDAQTREQISAVSDKVLMGEYAEAVETVNTLLAAKEN